MWTEIICVGAGSCLGGIMRYLSTKYIQSAVAATFPWGTLAVNVVGSLIIGFVLGLVDRGIAIPPTVKLFLTVGFCGGFTTFSTFANENYLLFQSSQFPVALLYAGVSVLAGFAAVYLGYFFAKWV